MHDGLGESVAAASANPATTAVWARLGDGDKAAFTAAFTAFATTMGYFITGHVEVVLQE